MALKIENGQISVVSKGIASAKEKQKLMLMPGLALKSDCCLTNADGGDIDEYLHWYQFQEKRSLRICYARRCRLNGIRKELQKKCMKLNAENLITIIAQFRWTQITTMLAAMKSYAIFRAEIKKDYSLLAMLLTNRQLRNETECRKCG